MGEIVMAEKVEDFQRVRVSLSQAEINALLIQPAKDAGFIDFDPTRVLTQSLRGGDFEITFERTTDPRQDVSTRPNR